MIVGLIGYDSIRKHLAACGYYTAEIREKYYLRIADAYIDIKEQRGQYWLENIMKDRFAVSMFGQKRLSREGGIEIVVKELCTRMARDGCQVTCYNRSGHHVSGAEYDNKIEYDGIRQKFVPTIERKGLAAKKVIKTPFIVINADDYYGKEGFKAVHDYLVNGGKSCMAGFVLKNTLSDNGSVTRGICKMDENGNLKEVVETKNIVKTANGAEADGVVVDVNSLVSMNMWGLTPEFLDVLEEGFKEFFEKEVPSNPQKAEYLIPIFIGELLEQGKMSVKVLKTNDTWYGMTYHEDVAAVKDSFKKMLVDGVYKADLFSDL